MLEKLALTIHDNSAKLILMKCYTSLIGAKATILLMHLCNTLENEYRIAYDRDGKIWHKQNLAWMTYHTTLPLATLLRAKERLVSIGLIETTQEQSTDRTTHWRVCEEKLYKFFAFANALRLALRPNNSNTFGQWEAWRQANPAIVAEFGYLYPGLENLKQSCETSHFIKTNPSKLSNCEVVYNNKSIEQKEELAKASKQPSVADCLEVDVVMVRTKWPRERIDAKNSRAFEPPPEKIEPEVTCQYVDYWNTLPYVPKCRKGTKSYKRAKEFFTAHKRYQAGTEKFVLTPDEQERLKLDRINMIPPDAKKIGKSQTPVRSHDQMFKHIKKAALTYHPQYYPQDKKWMPRSLPNFLYNSHSKKYGQTSLFLERLLACPAKSLTECTYDTLYDSATQKELDMINIIQTMYAHANGIGNHQELTFKEFKSALTSARNILKKHDEIRENGYGAILQFIGSLAEFVSFWKQHCYDHLWEGMPISSFDVGKNLWRSFVDNISEDIGVNIFTGARVN